jgi:hypothetical protein
MFDLNAIVNAAIATAVAEAIKPLIERIETLEASMENTKTRMGLAEARITDIVVQPAVAVDEAKMVEALNSQGWFWEKLHSKISDHVSSRVEEAMDDHCSTYDHDEYDNVVSNWNDEDPTEFVRESDMESKINDVLNNATVSISV